MPYVIYKPPSRIKKLPPHAISIWISAFNSAWKQYNKDEERCNKVAWSAVKKVYKKVGEKWVRKANELIFPINLSELKFDEETKKSIIQIFKVGVWKHPVYGKIKISEKDLGEFVDNFNNGVRKDIPITEGHSVGEQELPAVGWFKQLINKGREGLWATVEWTSKGIQLLKDNLYKYFSPEFYSTYEDPESHKVYSNVLVGGALTNRPYFKGLAGVVLSEYIFEENNTMTLEELLKKDKEELTDEEKDFLKENKEELTEEQKEDYKDILKEGEGKTEEELEAEKKEEEEKAEAEAKEKEAKEKKKSSEVIAVNKQSLDILSKKAEEGVKAMTELRKMQADKFVNSYVFGESNSNGLFLPKSREKVVGFYLSLSEEQRIEFKAILDGFPKAKLFSELGAESGIPVKASEQLDSLIKTKMEKDDKLEYRQALDQVLAEKPELAKAYENESS